MTTPMSTDADAANPPKRVAVFIDYQNCYRSARRAFCDEYASHVEGQVRPLRLALKLKGPDRELVAVRVYRGMPSSKHDQVGHAATDRETALWRQNEPLVRAITRPLNYRDPKHPKEKGVDVRLAVDMVVMAMMKLYDVAILVSEDTDLLPALEAIIAMKGPQACEVATWVPADGSSATPLRVRGHSLAVHRLTQRDYTTVHDPTDFSLRRRRR